MSRIDRYILGTLIGSFGLASLVLVMVYWVNRAVMLFDELIRDGQSAWVFLEFTALALPTIVRIVLPLAAFVATLWAYNRMMGDTEITVMQATGASPWRLARPALLFGLLVALAVSVLSHLLSPAAAERLRARAGEIAETATARVLREGEFVSPLAGLTIYLREITPQGELRGLLLSDTREAGVGDGAALTITAASAFLVRTETGPQLVMVDGQIQRLDRATGRLVVTAFDDFAYDLSPLMPAGGGSRSVREAGTLEMLRATPALEAELGEPAATLAVRAHLRIAEALIAPTAALIAAASMLVAPFSRLGAWPQMVLAVVLAILAKLAETAAEEAALAAPQAWPVIYAPALAGCAVAAGLLWLAARPRPRPRRAPPGPPDAPPGLPA